MAASGLILFGSWTTEMSSINSAGCFLSLLLYSSGPASLRDFHSLADVDNHACGCLCRLMRDQP